jgi:hypothetical protein
MIGPARIERCRMILEFDSVTNFQTRMVAEIHLYWCMYENCTVAFVDLTKAQNALKVWKEEWQFLMGMSIFFEADGNPPRATEAIRCYLFRRLKL